MIVLEGRPRRGREPALVRLGLRQRALVAGGRLKLRDGRGKLTLEALFRPSDRP
jgi:hypothetical protein